MPLGSPGQPKQALAISFIRLGVDNIPDTRGLDFLDVNGNGKFDYPEDRLIVDESRFVFDSDNDVALLFSYARAVGRSLSLGGSLKVIRQWLGDSLRSNGFGLDVAALYVGPHGLSAGAKLTDATTTRILWNTGTNEFIAPSLRLGGAKTQAFRGRRHVVTAALDVQVGFSDERLSSQATWDRSRSNSTRASSIGSSAAWPCAWASRPRISPRGPGSAIARSGWTTPSSTTRI